MRAVILGPAKTPYAGTILKNQVKILEKRNKKEKLGCKEAGTILHRKKQEKGKRWRKCVIAGLV
jgi:rRNA processing protein Gar1